MFLLISNQYNYNENLMKNRPVLKILYLAQKHVDVQIMLMFEPYTILH